MLIIAEKVNDILHKKNLSRQNLSDFLKKDKSYISRIFSGDRPFPEKIIEKLIPILEVSKEEFEGWIIADKYPKDALKLAIQIKTDFPYKRKSVLTTKIDEILQHKNMSRTALAKQINYSQSGLNQIITGKRSVPKSVLKKLSYALDISRNDILSWILADKYNLQILKTAYSCINT